MAARGKGSQRVVATLKRGALPLIKVNDPRGAANAAARLIGNRASEWFVAMYLNAQNKVVAYDEFSSGAVSSVTVYPSSIIRNALLAGAVGVITAHNHPSGSPDPSSDDRALFKKLESQGELMDILVLDHLVIGARTYVAKSSGWEAEAL